MEDRREFLVKSVGVGLGAIAASQIGSALISSTISSADAAEKTPAAEKISAAEKALASEGLPTATGPASDVMFAKLAQVASDCVRTGYACINHCEKELALGRLKMAKCNSASHEMVAIAQAMLLLASYNSPRALKMVPLFQEACKSCGDSCLEHKIHWSMGMHLECKACYEACVQAEKVCSNIRA
jgi:Cys-rich four helix bundle protein (predicted Tat secretion target)